MDVRLRLFAMQRQAVGAREVRVSIPEGGTIGDAWRALLALHPELEPAGATLRYARNAVYAEPDTRLAEGDEVALIPPVAGGSGEADVDAEPGSKPGRFRRIELRADPFSDALLAELRRTVPTAAEGALVLFVGQTRESPGTPAPGQEAEAARHAGAQVLALDYEAFEPMAVAVLDQVADEIERRFGVDRLAILHRTGEVSLGEASVVIAAAAAHRGEAFDACRYAIEELKARAPIWKSERFTDGQVWIGQPARTGPLTGPPDSR